MTLPEHDHIERREQRLREFEHDLRDYLGVIVTYSDLLSRSASDRSTVDGLGAIHESATLAIELTDRFRDASVMDRSTSR